MWKIREDRPWRYFNRKAAEIRPLSSKFAIMNHFDHNHVVIGENSCGYYRLTQYFLNISIVSVTLYQ